MARWLTFPWRWLLVLSLAGGLLGGWAPRASNAAPLTAITPEDEAALTRHLKILTYAWDPSSADEARMILIKEQYTIQDWIGYFSGYFQQNPYTDPLWDFLNWPSFWSSDEYTQWKLQTALTQVFRAKIAVITAENSSALSQALAADANLRQTLSNTHRWMMNITQNGRLYEPQMRELFDFYLQYVEAYPDLWAKQHIDPAAQPVIAPLAAQIHANIRELVWTDETGKQRVEAALRLSGRYHDLWDNFTLLLYDNSSLSDMQLNFLYAYFNALPPALRLTRGISVADRLENQEPYRISLWLNGVNIIADPIGRWTENGFPPDVAPLPCDGFSIVAWHEINHSVNALYIEKQSVLRDRQAELINNAGNEPMNYLRSGSEAGFFVQNPQEFFAAIANQWFCSSEHTFRLGMERMRKGRPHPLEQALFFADVYSMNTAQTYLYSSDSLGRTNRQAVPFYRDAWGLPTGIGLPGAPLYVWRENGVIGQVGTQPPVIEVSPPDGLLVRLPPGEERTAALRVRNTGGLNAAVRFMNSGPGVAEFEGGGLRVPNSPSLNFTNQITVEAWINPRTWDDGYLGNGRVLQKGYADSQYRLLVENGNFVFDLEWVGRLSILDWKPPLDTWTHVAATYDGERMRIYINGAQRAEKPATGKLRVTQDDLYIGNKDERLVDRFMGKMDEVRLWSVSRTVDEIRRDMNRRIAPGSPGLVGWWNFDPQPDVTPVLDWSGQQNHAEPVGAVTVHYGSKDIAMGGTAWENRLAPGAETAREFTFSSIGLAPGSYEKMLTIESNDPARPIIQVPIRMIVTDPQPVELENPIFLPLVRR